MLRPRPGGARLAGACLAAFALSFLNPAAPRGASPDIVISQVYGGGGNSGATLTHDFIELFNRSGAPVSLTGWSVQYASSSGTTWQKTELSGTIPAGGYYLIRQAQGAGGTTPLPTPDASGTILMSATAGKVIVVSTTVVQSGACPAGATIVDIVGFGSATTCSETAPTPALTNTTAALRNAFGCTDTDNNAGDFTVGTPDPRNSASPLNTCEGPPSLSIDDVSVAEGDSGTTHATFTVTLNGPAPADGVTFDISTQDDTATVADADYVARNLTGQTIPGGATSYSFEVEVIGDTALESNETFHVNLANATGAVIGRAQGTGTIVNDDFAPPVFDVVISQVYGGGGNAGATYTHDFVELFNRGTTAVSLTGWSVQYNSAAGTGTWQKTNLTGTIEPGKYYLVQQASGAGGTVGLPAPDAMGSIAMAAGSGKVALLSTTTEASGACAAGSTVVDLVGYGTAMCFEGAAAAPVLTNTTAALRKRGGCFDSNDNGADFLSGSPAPRNSAAPARSCEFLTVPIHAIQGTGLSTPLAGQDVTTTGIVTALKTNGFFMQTPDDSDDGDPATSEGLFVFTATPPTVTAGDLVTVKGTSTEFFSLTQVEATLAGDVTVTSSGNTLPSPVLLTTTVLDPNGLPTQLEPLEGMRVHAPALVSVAPTNGFGEIYTVLSGVPRPLREPGIEARHPIPPDPITGMPDCCIPIWDMNPERVMVDTDGLAGSAAFYVTSNVTLTGVTGPLDFSFSNYKVLPEVPPAVSPNSVAAPVPMPSTNEFTVAGYNIENFNNNETQRRKAAIHIRTIMRSPEVVGVIEIANLAALQALAAQVNSDAVAAGEVDPQYEARLVPFGSNAQHVGFLVKASRVQIHDVRQERSADTFINPITGSPEILHDRPPLVLDATVDPAGANPARVLVVVNHLRSFIDIELVGGEGPRVRAKRTAQAESVAGLLQELQQSNPGVLVISVGDYNAYQFSDGYTDPIAILKGLPTPGDQIVVPESPDLIDPDLRNLTDTLVPEQRYSFIFEGTPQALDHILVNDAAFRYFQRYAVARSNADFPDAPAAGLFGNAARPEANSDHDSPIAYFTFPGRPVVTLNGGAVVEVEAFTSFVDPGATAQDDNGPLPVTVGGTVNVNVPGTYTLSYTATNAHASTTVQRTVIVRDTIAPVISGFAMTPSTFGPPNHEMFDALASYVATDASGVTVCALSVTSNELANGAGDGNTEQDWTIVSPTLVQLRAERAGSGTGRVYTVSVTCTDSSGNSSSTSATVTIQK